jgi:hypothetical protein
MSCSSVEFAEEKWESVCHFIPKISSSVACTIAVLSWYVFYRDNSITDDKTMAPFSSQKLSWKVPEAPPVC